MFNPITKLGLYLTSSLLVRTTRDSDSASLECRRVRHDDGREEVQLSVKISTTGPKGGVNTKYGYLSLNAEQAAALSRALLKTSPKWDQQKHNDTAFWAAFYEIRPEITV